jgi:hypothetical protein
VAARFKVEKTNTEYGTGIRNAEYERGSSLPAVSATDGMLTLLARHAMRLHSAFPFRIPYSGFVLSLPVPMCLDTPSPRA